MKRSVIVAAIVIMIVVATLVVLLENNGGQSNTSEATPPSVGASSQTSSQTPGAYVDYREGIIAETSGNKALFFHAPWCPQCRSIEQGIKSDGVPDGWTIIKVDYDSNQELRKKYGVTQQTTFVKVDSAGNKTASYVAYENPQFTVVRDNFLLK